MKKLRAENMVKVEKVTEEAREKVKEKELFLEQLCLRAGASKESWKEPGAELYTFQAQVFREE